MSDVQTPAVKTGRTAHVTPSASAAPAAMSIVIDQRNHETRFGFVLPEMVSFRYARLPRKLTAAPSKTMNCVIQTVLYDDEANKTERRILQSDFVAMVSRKSRPWS